MYLRLAYAQKNCLLTAMNCSSPTNLLHQIVDTNHQKKKKQKKNSFEIIAIS